MFLLAGGFLQLLGQLRQAWSTEGPERDFQSMSRDSQGSRILLFRGCNQVLLDAGKLLLQE